MVLTSLASRPVLQRRMRSAQRESAAALSRWGERFRLGSTGREASDVSTISSERAPRLSARDVYCYFDNTDKHHAPGDAVTLMRLLRLAAPMGPGSGRRWPRGAAHSEKQQSVKKHVDGDHEKP